MTDTAPIRCPNCLTDGQVDASLDIVVCPVCSTTLRRVSCPACGSTHVVDDGAPTMTCPATGQQFHLAPGAVTPVTTPPVAAAAAPQPIATQPEPPAWGAPPPTVEAGWGQSPAPQPSPAPTAAADTSSGPSKKALVITIVAALVIIALVVVLIVHHESNAADPVQQTVLTELNTSSGAATAACHSIHTVTGNRAALVSLLDSVPAADRTSFITSLKAASASWLPRDAVTWNFAQVREALLYLWDECARRGLNG